MTGRRRCRRWRRTVRHGFAPHRLRSQFQRAGAVESRSRCVYAEHGRSPMAGAYEHELGRRPALHGSGQDLTSHLRTVGDAGGGTGLAEPAAVNSRKLFSQPSVTSPTTGPFEARPSRPRACVCATARWSSPGRAGEIYATLCLGPRRDFAVFI